MKSSLDIIKEIKNNTIELSGRKSMVEKSTFKDEVEFAGSNLVLRQVYKKCLKT